MIESNQSFPEPSPPALAVVPHEVDSDAKEPGVNPALSPKAVAFPVSAQEAFLSQSVSRVAVPHEQEDHPIHSPLVLAYDLVEPLG